MGKRLANNDSRINNEVFNKLATTATGHPGRSCACLIAYYQELEHRFLLKNDKFWVSGYYMPDYSSQLLFAVGLATVISALKFN